MDGPSFLREVIPPRRGATLVVLLLLLPLLTVSRGARLGQTLEVREEGEEADGAQRVQRWTAADALEVSVQLRPARAVEG